MKRVVSMVICALLIFSLSSISSANAPKGIEEVMIDNANSSSVFVPSLVGKTYEEGLAIIQDLGLESVSFKDAFITEEEFMQILDNNPTESVSPMIDACCDRRPSFAWRYKRAQHVTDEKSKCIRLSFVGDKYCIYCKAIWEIDGVYNVTTTGCGGYH